MELEEKLKLAFKQGMAYKNMWTEKHGYNEKYSFDNWLSENKQLLITDVVVSEGTLSDDEETPIKTPKNIGYGKGGEKVYI